MKLLSLLDKKKKVISVQGITLCVKRLNWDELQAFQAFAEGAETKTEGDEDDIESTIKVCAYVLDNFVTYEDGDKVVDTGEIRKVPVEFCTELMERFMDSLHAGAEDLKKK